MEENQLIIKNVTKTYPNGLKALDGINMNIGNGMFGLLGPNGAGKSTLMRTIATLQDPSHGTLQFNEININTDPEKLRKVLGFLPQEFGVYPKVSAWSLLDHIAILKGVTHAKERKKQVEQLLVQTNLYQHRRKAVRSFSGGMLRRFGIAQALLANPKLIIVDEPTAGLDPEERNRFLNLLSEIGEHIIVILSTHIVEDVDNLCSEMAILKEGKISKQGSPLKLTQEIDGKIWQKSISKMELEKYRSQYSIISTKLVSGSPIIHIKCDRNPGNGFQSVIPSLEDVYFSTLHN